MNRVKLVVFIVAILLSGITAVITYAAQTSSPGSTMTIITSNKTWQFYAKSNMVNVYFENISNFMTTVSVKCVNSATDTEYYTLLPKEMTSRMSYHTIDYVEMYNVPIEWAFTIGVSNSTQIVGYASWN